MDQILRELELEWLIPVFEDNYIDLDAFLLLSETELKEIISPVGPRVKLIHKQRELTSLKKVHVLAESDGEAKIVFVESQETPGISELTSSELTTVVIPDHTPTPTDTISSNSSFISSVSTNIRTENFHEENRNEYGDENNLLTFLKSCNDGLEIIQTFKLTGVVKRRKLVDLILNNELRNDLNKRISKERFLQLSQNICKIFPTESAVSYYIPAFRNKKGQPVSAHGKLWDKYINLRTKYQRLELVPKRKRKNSTLSSDDCQSNDTEDDNNEEYQEMINFLKVSTSDWGKILDFWRKTSKKRIKNYNKDETEIHQYFKTFPSLSMPHGYELISIDFSILYPGKVEALINKWPTICRGIINVGKSKNCPIINKTLGQLQLGESYIYQEEIVALFVLPLLFPNTFRGTRKNIKKFSKKEMLESFFFYVESEENFQLELQRRDQKLMALKEHDQPFVFLIANKGQHPRSILKINENIYEIESPIRAIDLCFQSFFVLSAKYPYQCDLTWGWMEEYIYEIPKRSSKPQPTISCVQSDIVSECQRLLLHAIFFVLHCKNCNKEYSCDKIYFSHFQILHKNVTSFPCAHCYRTFSSILTLRKHHRKEHVTSSALEMSSESSYVCLPQFNVANDNDLEPLAIQEDKPEQTHSIINVNLDQLVTNNYMEFLTKLHHNRKIPIKHIFFILRDVTQICNFQINFIQEKINSVISTSESDLQLVKSELTNLLSKFTSITSKFKSEYLFTNMLLQQNLYNRPIKINVGSRRTVVRRHSRRCYVNSDVSVSYISIKQTLLQIFSIPGCLDFIKKHVIELENEDFIISNFIQAELWKQKQKNNPDKFLLPLFLYFDEFEVGNPLGSHSGINKLGAVYFSIPVLPDEVLSKLDYIFLVMLFKTSDYKLVGNDGIFQNLIEELLNLREHGISVENQQIFFEFGLTLGDNLGQNQLLGFIESFSGHYCCRLCKEPKVTRQTLCSDASINLRDRINYNEDLLTNNSSETGIKQNCTFNKIPGFHVTENFTCDIMHDLLEGVCKYDFLVLLNYFIVETKSFSIDTLNYRIKLLQKNENENNRPPILYLEDIKNKKIRLSASEMLFLTRYFGVLVGDLVPKGNAYWNLYQSLNKLVKLVFAKKLQKSCVQILRDLVQEHNKLYLQLSKSHLSFKAHMLLHYPKIFEMSGPLDRLSSMRFESKHRSLKDIATAINSRKNIAYSLAKRHQLGFSFCLLMRTLKFEDQYCFGKTRKLCKSLYEFPIIKSSFREDEDYFMTSSVKINGTRYSKNSVITIDDGSLEVRFGLLSTIIGKQSDQSFVAFVYNHLDCLGFDEHFQAFEVALTDTLDIIHKSNMFSYVPCTYYIDSIKEKEYVITPYHI